MNVPQTSRRKFSEFLTKYRTGTLDREKHDRVPNNSSSDRGVDSNQKLTKRQNRRRFLGQYLTLLKSHWGSVSLLVILSLVIAGLEVVQPLFYRYIIDQVLLKTWDSSLDQVRELNRIGLWALAFVLAAQGLGIFKNYHQYLLNVRVILHLRRDLFHRLLRLPLERLAEMKTGGIISRLTDDVNTTTGLFELAIVSPGVAIIRLLISIGILFFLNWQLALTAISIIPFIMGISFWAARRVRPIYRQVRDDVSVVDGRVGEAFEGIRSVRAFRGELREEHEYVVGHNAITRVKLFARKRELVLWSSWGLILAVIGLVIFWVGGYLSIQGRASIGDITAFQVYTFMLLNPVWQIVNSFSELQRSLAAMERVFEVLETPEDKPDLPHAQLAPNSVTTLEFRHVHFAYETGRPVIQDFSLKVPGGSVVALVGKSGAGKTTLTDLLARFYDPTQGVIELNGIDLKELQLSSYRDLLGVVQQETFLFDGSVRDNIAYARRDATPAEIEDAARRANAWEFIEKLPEGLNTMIGERGVKLSGGQRQRLSIARALLADPKILILDEATSNLDSESEQLIQRSLVELLKNRTTFIIAHRLSTITHADWIVVLEDGRLIEQGRHEDLMRQGGSYFEMIQRQQSSLSL